MTIYLRPFRQKNPSPWVLMSPESTPVHPQADELELRDMIEVSAIFSSEALSCP